MAEYTADAAYQLSVPNFDRAEQLRVAGNADRREPRHVILPAFLLLQNQKGA